jgi:hypothetical protein
VLVLIAIGCVTISQGAQTSTNVITGTLEKVDSGVKTIAVKTADGTVERMNFTDKTAHSVEWMGDKTVHTTEGTVEDGKDSKTVAVKTADGMKEGFVVADHAVVNTGKDVARYSAQGAKKGEHVTVYYTEEAGKKIAHVFKHL